MDQKEKWYLNVLMQTACPADTTDEHPYKTLRGAHPGGIACTGQADVYTVSQKHANFSKL